MKEKRKSKKEKKCWSDLNESIDWKLTIDRKWMYSKCGSMLTDSDYFRARLENLQHRWKAERKLGNPSVLYVNVLTKLISSVIFFTYCWVSSYVSLCKSMSVHSSLSLSLSLSFFSLFLLIWLSIRRNQSFISNHW